MSKKQQPPHEAPPLDAEFAAESDPTTATHGSVAAGTEAEPPPEPLLPLWEVRLEPHNPGTRQVRAANEAEALKAYYREMSIVQSDNQPKFVRLEG